MLGRFIGEKLATGRDTGHWIDRLTALPKTVANYCTDGLSPLVEYHLPPSQASPWDALAGPLGAAFTLASALAGPRGAPLDTIWTIQDPTPPKGPWAGALRTSVQSRVSAARGVHSPEIATPVRPNDELGTSAVGWPSHKSYRMAIGTGECVWLRASGIGL